MLPNVTDGHFFLQPQPQLQEERKRSQLQQDCKWRLRDTVTLYREIPYFVYVVCRFGACREISYNTIRKCGLPCADFEDAHRCSGELCAHLLYQILSKSEINVKPMDRLILSCKGKCVFQ